MRRSASTIQVKKYCFASAFVCYTEVNGSSKTTAAKSKMLSKGFCAVMSLRFWSFSSVILSCVKDITTQINDRIINDFHWDSDQRLHGTKLLERGTDRHEICTAIDPFEANQTYLLAVAGHCLFFWEWVYVNKMKGDESLDKRITKPWHGYKLASAVNCRASRRELALEAKRQLFRMSGGSAFPIANFCGWRLYIKHIWFFN